MRTLSILITYYNEKELLTECLRSLANQEFPPEEVLIYDDASEFPAEKYTIPELPIRIIRSSKNLGPSHGRNVLLKETKGSYTHFHDSDDWFFREWSGKVRRAIEDKQPDAVYTEVASYRNGKLFQNNVIGLEGIRSETSLLQFCIRNFMLVPAGTFKTSLIRNMGGYRQSLWQSEDYDFNIRVAAQSISYEIIQESLVGIRLRPESRSRNRSETLTYALQAIVMLEKELPPTHHIELSEKAADLGSQLFRIGDKVLAKEAFALALKLGPPRFVKEGSLYQTLAKSFGQEFAEWAGWMYRAILPQKVRSFFRQ